MVSSETARRTYPDGSSISFWTAPDGWQLRRFDWPSTAAKPRGSILFQGGRGDIFEKYLETFHHWHDQGWTITSFDWRGQGGSGRLTDDPHVGDIDRFGTYLADYGAFWQEWVAATPGPHVAMGHSMGGHLVCRALDKVIAEPDAAVLIAPMMGLHAPISAGFGERVAEIAMRLGNPQRRAWKSNEKPGTTDSRPSLLTHDADRYSDEPWWWEQKPEIKLGPPSWRWVVRAFESTRRLRASRRVKCRSSCWSPKPTSWSARPTRSRSRGCCPMSGWCGSAAKARMKSCARLTRSAIAPWGKSTSSFPHERSNER
jgi:lysophospholipase